MALLTESYLRQKAAAKSGFQTEAYQRDFAVKVLANEARSARSTDSFDIFLSHASEDAMLVKALRDELTEAGYTVYVDWIDDPQLDRSHVNTATAAALRERMRQCKSLLFATSSASRKSVWMPWELGYMDAYSRMRVAIVPIVPDGQSGNDFRGQEYLGLYPYFDKTGSTFYIHESSHKYVSFSEWLRNFINPYSR